MTHSIGQAAFFETGRFCRVGGVAFLLALAGCATGGNSGATAPVEAPSEMSVSPSEAGAQDTGTFPNLNVPPQVAAPQLTQSERDAKLAQLKADKSGQGSGGARPKASGAELGNLARNHGKDALKEIEAKCDPALDPTCK